MHVAVAFADEAVALPRDQVVFAIAQFLFAPRPQPFDLILHGGVFGPFEMREVRPDRSGHRLRRAKPGGRFCDGNFRMEFGHLPGQRIDVPRLQFLCGDQPAEQVLLIEPEHSHAVFDASPVPPIRGDSAEPVMGMTSKYNCGASRRLSRNSSSQKKRRRSSVVKSTNPRSTGFLTL